MKAGRAITRFALAELQAAGRRMRHRLQRCPASGVYGDNTLHRTLWDEFRHDLKFGPAPALEDAWDHTLRAFASGIVERMPTHTQALLGWHLANLELIEPDDVIDQEALVGAVCEAAREIAAW